MLWLSTLSMVWAIRLSNLFCCKLMSAHLWCMRPWPAQILQVHCRPGAFLLLRTLTLTYTFSLWFGRGLSDTAWEQFKYIESQYVLCLWRSKQYSVQNLFRISYKTVTYFLDLSGTAVARPWFSLVRSVALLLMVEYRRHISWEKI